MATEPPPSHRPPVAEGENSKVAKPVKKEGEMGKSASFNGLTRTCQGVALKNVQRSAKEKREVPRLRELAPRDKRMPGGGIHAILGTFL